MPIHRSGIVGCHQYLEDPELPGTQMLSAGRTPGTFPLFSVSWGLTLHTDPVLATSRGFNGFTQDYGHYPILRWWGTDGVHTVPASVSGYPSVHLARWFVALVVPVQSWYLPGYDASFEVKYRTGTATGTTILPDGYLQFSRNGSLIVDLQGIPLGNSVDPALNGASYVRVHPLALLASAYVRTDDGENLVTQDFSSSTEQGGFTWSVSVPPIVEPPRFELPQTTLYGAGAAYVQYAYETDNVQPSYIPPSLLRWSGVQYVPPRTTL